MHGTLYCRIRESYSGTTRRQVELNQSGDKSKNYEIEAYIPGIGYSEISEQQFQTNSMPLSQV